jgi:hypothetical protein
MSGQRQRREYSRWFRAIINCRCYDFKHQYERFYSENIFEVYIAVDNSQRSELWKTINAKPSQFQRKYCASCGTTPAKILYEKLGFTNDTYKCVSSNSPKWKNLHQHGSINSVA